MSLGFERFMNGEVIGQKKLIRNYSAGNKQKIGIISAMLHQPQVLVLDEPFNFLDPSSQSIIKHLLKAYNEETGTTILVSSHNLNHTVDICPRIALLENGKIIRDIDNKGNSAEKELEDYFNVTEMKKLLSHLLVLGTLAMLLVSCGTSAPRYNYKELARASIRLNMDIDMKDNHNCT